MLFRSEEPVLKRYNREPFIAVHAEVSGVQPNDMTAAIWQATEELRNRIPPDYRIDIGGSVEQSGKADASIQKLQPLMIAFMLIFVMPQIRRFVGMFIVVATAPMVILGADLGMLLFGPPFGFVALLR